MKIKTVKRKINKFGIRKYAEIGSMTVKGKTYIIGKARKRNSRNYKYVCTCPDYFYRQKTCKHIKLFKTLEKGL
jgi:hypothetical protein